MVGVEEKVNIVNTEKDIEKKSDNEISDGNKVFKIEILRLIKEAQQQHGLRHGDYQRYRGYCSRRVRRLRKALKIPQGEKRHFKKRDVTTANLEGKNADKRFIQIPLMLAERAWSYAMQLRQEAQLEIRKKFHLISRLRKACLYALQLQELCNSDACDARTKLEAKAYVAWMHGTLHFELSLWKKAAENLEIAQVVYKNLINALPEEEQTLYKAKVDELTPSLRYCAYNIGDGGGSGMDDLLELRAQGVLSNLDSLVSQTKSQSSESLETVEWRKRKVTVRSEKVRLFLLSIQELDKSIEKAKTIQNKIELLENMLIDCKDAISAVKDDIKQDPKLRQNLTNATANTTGTGGNFSSVPGVQYLLAYLSYIRLIRTIERNLYLVALAKQNQDENMPANEKIEGNNVTSASGGSGGGGGGNKKTRPQDFTRLYEIISQNIIELQQIAGMEDDKIYQNEIDILSISFKAFRCYYIALTLVALKRWKEAVAMYSRATNYASVALKTKPQQFQLERDLMHLLKNIEGCKFSAHAYSVLEDDNTIMDESNVYGKFQQKTTNKPLYERLSQYKEDQQLNTKNPNVFKLTPDMEPIPCKPLFFDIALNFVEFPSLDDKLDVPGSMKKGAAGISGFVKGFLGWGSGGGGGGTSNDTK